MMCAAYIHAKEIGKPFFIENNKEWPWQYTYKNGWHDYFKSLTPYTGHSGNVAIYTHTHPYISELPFEKYTSAIKEIFVLNDDLEKRVQEFISDMGSPYKAVYIRRGDKVSGPEKEMDATNVAELIKTMGIADNDKLFVMSDDYAVVKEIKGLLPNVKVFTLTPAESNGSVIHDLRAMSTDDMKKHAEELFMSIQICFKAEKAWVDNRSNLGRFIKMGSPNTVVLYPADNGNKDIPPNTLIMPWEKLLPV